MIVIPVYEGVDLLDVAGPTEMFLWADVEPVEDALSRRWELACKADVLTAVGDQLSVTGAPGLVKQSLQAAHVVHLVLDDEFVSQTVGSHFLG